MEKRHATVVLDELLYREAKRAAVEQGKNLKEIIEEALRIFLRDGQQQMRKDTGPRFGVYAGKARTDLRRDTIYRDLKK